MHVPVVPVVPGLGEGHYEMRRNAGKTKEVMACSIASGNIEGVRTEHGGGENLRVDHTSLDSLRTKLKDDHEEVRLDVGKLKEYKWGGGDLQSRRYRPRTAAVVCSSGEKIQRPGGAIWRGMRGEMERMSRATYRVKNGKKRWP